MQVFGFLGVIWFLVKVWKDILNPKLSKYIGYFRFVVFGKWNLMHFDDDLFFFFCESFDSSMLGYDNMSCWK